MRERERTHVLPLDSLFHDVLARRRKQCRPAPFVHGIFHERFHALHPDFPQRPVCVHGLLQLVRRHRTGVRCVYPRPVVLGTLESGLVVEHAPHESADEEDLGEFGARVERVGSEVGVDLVEGCEFGGGEGGAVEVGGLEDEAGVWRRLEVGEEGEGEEHLGKVVDLEVGV